MGTCPDTCTAADTFVIVDQNAQLLVFVHFRNVRISDRTRPHTCVTPHTLFLIYLDNTHLFLLSFLICFRHLLEILLYNII